METSLKMNGHTIYNVKNPEDDQGVNKNMLMMDYQKK